MFRQVHRNLRLFLLRKPYMSDVLLHAQYFFLKYRVKHSLHRCLYIFNCIVDNTVQTDIYTFTVCCFFCSCIRTYIKSDDDRI